MMPNDSWVVGSHQYLTKEGRDDGVLGSVRICTIKERLFLHKGWVRFAGRYLFLECTLRDLITWGVWGT